MTLKRLNKFLSNAGVASRRKVEELIISKQVKINGKIVDKLATIIDTEKDTVLVKNKPIKEEKKVYFILNKPKGFLCSNIRKDREKLVIDLFKKLPYKLFTVGRLDRATTGLIIVTNDGDLANKIIHPSSNIEKEYTALVEETITKDHIKSITKGAFVENKWIRPKLVDQNNKNILKIVVKEGKKREIRILVKKAKLNLLHLKRVRIGNLKIGSLPEGYSKQVTLKELERIFS